MEAIVADLKENASDFLIDVGTHGKVFGADQLKQLVLSAPACRIGLIGSRPGGNLAARSSQFKSTMDRADSGQFRGPLQMVAFLIEKDWGAAEARDRVIDLADSFMTFIEMRTFGLTSDEAGPAMVTGFDILYSMDIDNQGAAIAAVNWEQSVFFGRNLHDEDLALLTGDINGLYPEGQEFYTEKEWADKGVIMPETQGPLVKGSVTKAIVPETQPETEEHEEIDGNEE